jgi:hypothetical protein
VLKNWGEEKIFTWADTTFSLPPGTAAKLNQGYQDYKAARVAIAAM